MHEVIPEKYDLSGDKSLEYLIIDASNGSCAMKLPKQADNLKSLYLYGANNKTLPLTAYMNLENVLIGYCKNLTSVDMGSNVYLKEVQLYQNPKLQESSVKLPKGVTVQFK